MPRRCRRRAIASGLALSVVYIPVALWVAYTLGYLQRRLNAGGAVLVQALLFASGHLRYLTPGRWGLMLIVVTWGWVLPCEWALETGGGGLWPSEIYGDGKGARC
jgi:membrane protease YdiL (CAAX protease family)